MSLCEQSLVLFDNFVNELIPSRKLIINKSCSLWNRTEKQVIARIQHIEQKSLTNYASGTLGKKQWNCMKIDECINVIFMHYNELYNINNFPSAIHVFLLLVYLYFLTWVTFIRSLIIDDKSLPHKLQLSFRQLLIFKI